MQRAAGHLGVDACLKGSLQEPGDIVAEREGPPEHPGGVRGVLHEGLPEQTQRLESIGRMQYTANSAPCTVLQSIILQGRMGGTGWPRGNM